MNKIRITSLLTGIAMIAAALLTTALTTNKIVADTSLAFDLNTLIPKQFSNWKQAQELEIISTPNTDPLARKIYEQTLSRTYINTRGDRIILTIAYGKDQHNGMQVHKPETCYPAQGFTITQSESGILNLTKSTKEIPVTRLVAVQGTRVEPITYWITIGNQIALDPLKWKIARFLYRISGKAPDGLLFRVSSIDDDYAHAFVTHANFINDLFESLTNAEQIRLIGDVATRTNNKII